MSEIITKLEQQANAIDTTPDSAIAAMVQLACIYGEGKVVPANLGLAYEWASKAVNQSSADGYMEYAKILGSACIAINDPPSKIEYADNVCQVCDVLAVTRFARPDIACAVATICEYMADYGRVNSAPASFVKAYHERAQTYYTLALMIPDNPDVNTSTYKQIASQALERLRPEQGKQRPSFTPGKILPYFGVG